LKKVIFFILSIFILVVCLSIFIFAGITDVGVKDDLVTVFNFSQTSGDLIDSIGGNDSTSVTVTNQTNTINCISGGCWDFKSSTDDILIMPTDILDGKDTFSMFCWVRPTDFHGVIFSGNSSASDTTRIEIDVGGKLTCSLASGDVGGAQSAGQLFSLRTWAHTGITYNSSNRNVSCYVDGVKELSFLSSDPAPVDTSSNFAIGALYDDSTHYNGLIDECYVWDRILPQDEIINLYNNGIGNFYPDFLAGSLLYENFQNNATDTTRLGGDVNWSITLEGILDSYSFAHNQSGTLVNVTNGTLLGSSQFVNVTLNVTETRGNYICGQFWFNDSNGNVNQTSLTESGACFTIDNTAPIISSLTLNNILPSALIDSVNITCVAFDADNDTLSYNYQWFINDTLSSYTTFHLSKENITINTNITGSCNISDSINTTLYQNTSKITVGDTTAPLLNSFSLSATSGTEVTVSVNCSDENSLSIDSPLITIFHSTAGKQINRTMNDVIDGNKYSETYTTVQASGTLTFTAQCMDGSGNTAINRTTFDNTLSFSIGTPPLPPSGGGGGGGGGKPTEEELEQCDKEITKWEVTSIGGLDRIDTILRHGSKKPREIKFKIFNTGIENINLELTCEDVEGSICQNVTFESKELTIEPSPFTARETFIEVITPEEADYSEEFTFNILADDGDCFEPLNIFAVMPSRFSPFNRFFRIGQLELSVFGTAIVLGIIASIILFSILMGLKNPASAWWFGTIAGLGVFSSIFFLL